MSAPDDALHFRAVLTWRGFLLQNAWDAEDLAKEAIPVKVGPKPETRCPQSRNLEQGVFFPAIVKLNPGPSAGHGCDPKALNPQTPTPKPGE